MLKMNSTFQLPPHPELRKNCLSWSSRIALVEHHHSLRPNRGSKPRTGRIRIESTAKDELCFEDCRWWGKKNACLKSCHSPPKTFLLFKQFRAAGHYLLHCLQTTTSACKTAAPSQAMDSAMALSFYYSRNHMRMLSEQEALAEEFIFPADQHQSSSETAQVKGPFKQSIKTDRDTGFTQGRDAWPEQPLPCFILSPARRKCRSHKHMKTWASLIRSKSNSMPSWKET